MASTLDFATFPKEGIQCGLLSPSTAMLCLRRSLLTGHSFGPELSGLPPHDMRMTYEAVKQMADRFPAIIKRVDMQGSAGTGDMGTDNWRYSTEAQFAGAIYIYYEGNLSEAEKVELRQLYKDRGARAFFRDRRYMIESRGPPQN